MNKETMTVHKALAELKTLDSRIYTATNVTFCTSNRHSNTKINGMSIDNFNNTVKDNFKSVSDLIKRRNVLKRAVVLSNAKTIVEIGGLEYTVAEAIEMNNHGIELKQNLLNELENQYNRAIALCNRENDKLSEKSTIYIQQMFGIKDAKTSSDEIERARGQYEEQNTYELIDPLNCKSIIESLRKEINDFNVEVDSILSVSNATTSIIIEY